ncbi:unnamed protein product [Didymodactylos carnosus]|uniref:Uncharacterized protein n=2 Tax=Didymodactylos carnosus TaxID=1234261 RepID=A0A815P0V4_9BILA|nr:unnamed protein product [Didymodactylos carnosus]CAF4317962.1 unnamed protein product [Didymodactylos carnosus]
MQANTITGKRNDTAVSWITDGNDTYVTLRSPGLYTRGHVDHEKVSGSELEKTKLPSHVSDKTADIKPITPPYPLNKNGQVITPRTVSLASMSHLKSITNDLQEDKLNMSDNISLTHSLTRSSMTSNSLFDVEDVKTNNKFQMLPKQSFQEESLHDEDAWMSILEVVNAELAAINKQEMESGYKSST